MTIGAVTIQETIRVDCFMTHFYPAGDLQSTPRRL
jgi:hypothetical protein